MGKIEKLDRNNKNYALFKKVLDNSYSQEWDQAIKEWIIDDYWEDDFCESNCACGKEYIKYVFQVKNKITKKKLEIGSSCISKFSNDELINDMKIRMEFLELMSLVIKNNEIKIKWLSRKLIAFLHEIKWIYDEKEKDFLIHVFNKRDKSDLSEKQKDWLEKILFRFAKNFKELKEKRHSL